MAYRYINHGSFGIRGVNNVRLLQSRATGVFYADYYERPSGKRRRLNLKKTDLIAAKESLTRLVQELSIGKFSMAAMAQKYILYVIQRGENGPIKIGISANLPSRVKNLQTGSAERIRILRAYTMRDVEKAVHAELEKSERLNGEWFPAKLLSVVDKFFNEDPGVSLSRAMRRMEQAREASALLGCAGLKNNEVSLDKVSRIDYKWLINHDGKATQGDTAKARLDAEAAGASRGDNPERARHARTGRDQNFGARGPTDALGWSGGGR